MFHQSVSPLPLEALDAAYFPQRSLTGRHSPEFNGGSAPRTEPRVAVSHMSISPKNLFGEEVVEGFYGGEFVVFYVEDGVELGDLDYVVDFLGQAEEF